MQDSLRGQRIGIFGGTFNPIHLGHLRAAEEVREQLGLARVLLMPSAQPPHKSASEEDPIAPAALRLEWARIAVADHPEIEVSDLEIRRGGASYTVDTVRELAEETAPEPPVFVIGTDAFTLLSTWREPDALLRLASFAVITRPPASHGSLDAWLPESVRAAFELEPSGRMAHHKSASTWIRAVEIRALAVSSSDVRERIRKGLSVRYLLPEAVRRAVLDSGVYAGPPADYPRESE